MKAAEHIYKATEHRFKQQEEARKAREHIFHEWECLQANIREISTALVTETNEMVKCNMEADIAVLINRKNQISNRLHID